MTRTWHGLLTWPVLTLACALGCSDGRQAENAQPVTAKETKVVEAPAPAVSTPAPARPGRLSIEPASFDVGDVLEGETVSRTYVLANDGEGPLTITRAKSRCPSCIEITLARTVIPAGESEDLIVDYDLTDRWGEFTRYIVVQTDDPEGDSITVTLEGEIIPEFSVDPLKITFGDVLCGETRTAQITLKRNFGGRVEFGAVEGAPDAIEVGDVQASASEGETVLVPLTLNAGLRPGPCDATLVFPVNGTLHDALEVSVSANVISPIRLAAEEIFFGMVPMSDTRSRSVRVVLSEGVAPDSVTVATDAEFLKAQVRNTEEDGQVVEIELRPAAAAGPFSAALHLSADYQGRPATCEATVYGIRSE